LSKNHFEFDIIYLFQQFSGLSATIAAQSGGILASGTPKDVKFGAGIEIDF
jgi:hypothetical protein